MLWRRIPIAAVVCMSLTVSGVECGQTAQPPRGGKVLKKSAETRPEINEATYKKIKKGIGKLTERDVLGLLGAADRIVNEKGELTLIWEETNYIHVELYRGVVESIHASFSRRLPSKAINRAAFDKLKTGMKEKEVEAILGKVSDRIPRDLDDVNVGRSWYDVNRIKVDIKKGKVVKCEYTKPNK